MNRKFTWLILFLFFLSLLLRKTGFGFSSVVINISGLLLCFVILSTKHFFKSTLKKNLFSLFLIVCISTLQYWFQTQNIRLPGLNENTFNIFIFTAWLIFSIFIFNELRGNILTFTLWLIISFVFTSSVFLNQREFHNLYRSSTYEDFIRSKFSEQRGIVADYYIDKYKNPDIEKSESYLKEAIVAEKIPDYEKALVQYNKSIDLNPDNPYSHYKRGLLKLTRLELNADVANSAVKDFSRTLRLDSTYTIAFFHRGLALGYLGLKGRAHLDMKKVWEMDSTLTGEAFIKKYGSSKKSFSKPFHP